MTAPGTPDLRIGSRGSPLALAQAREVRDRLTAAHPGLAVEIVVIRTSGDREQTRNLAEIGGKGLFTKEIEEGLLAGTIDLAAHSMKDMETILPRGLAVAAVLPREDPRDAFVSDKVGSLDDLPPGAVVGTSSLRRQAQVLHRRPDLRVVPFRGNVETRLRKLAAGEADATLLAMAGLNRLGMAHIVTRPLAPEEMLPAVAQGAIALEIRDGDARIRSLLAPLNDSQSAIRVTAERSLLAALDGSCRTPVAGLAELEGAGRLRLRGLAANPDGSGLHAVAREGTADEAEAMGRDAGRELRAAMGPAFFA